MHENDTCLTNYTVINAIFNKSSLFYASTDILVGSTDKIFVFFRVEFAIKM